MTPRNRRRTRELVALALDEVGKREVGIEPSADLRQCVWPPRPQFRTVGRGHRRKAIDARRDLQDAYVADMRRKMQKTVWQNATCTAFYRKNMTEEVTSLAPEPVTAFILSRKWFHLSDYRLLK